MFFIPSIVTILDSVTLLVRWEALVAAIKLILRASCNEAHGMGIRP